MMKWEFEKIAGYDVTSEDFENIINPMYMATDLDKESFVKCLDRKRFEHIDKDYVAEYAKLKKEIKERIATLRDDIEYYKRFVNQYKSWLDEETDPEDIAQYKRQIAHYKNEIALRRSEISGLLLILK